MKTLALLTLLAVPLFAATPAEMAIQQAAKRIEQQPDHYPYYNNLAMAYARRARETSDTAYYTKAEETLRKSFAISANNFEGLKIQAWLELGRHEFAKARQTATLLNKTAPDDVAVYGYLVDADAELGNYKEAVASAQWMLDLRPGNIAGLVRASYLREIHGDLRGALDLMQMAADSTNFSETEDRAWLATQMSHLHLLSNDLEKAEGDATEALALFPGYHYALNGLAQVRLAQKRYADAVKLLRARYEKAPHAENLFALAEALDLAGEKDAAADAFRTFEKQSNVESASADNSNHELITYYIEHARQPAKALELARLEIARRHDVHTLDAYAWALAANGDYTAAGAEIRKALAVGVKDPKILAHAAAIEKRATERAGAVE